MQPYVLVCLDAPTGARRATKYTLCPPLLCFAKSTLLYDFALLTSPRTSFFCVFFLHVCVPFMHNLSLPPSCSLLPPLPICFARSIIFACVSPTKFSPSFFFFSYVWFQSSALPSFLPSSFPVFPYLLHLCRNRRLRMWTAGSTRKTRPRRTLKTKDIYFRVQLRSSEKMHTLTDGHNSKVPCVSRETKPFNSSR